MVLTELQISSELKNLKGWFEKDNSIRKVFNTHLYPKTIALVNAIALLSQQFDHHPDYMIVKYSELEVAFSTHTEKGITEKDIKLASEIEKLNLID